MSISTTPPDEKVCTAIVSITGANTSRDTAPTGVCCDNCASRERRRTQSEPPSPQGPVSAASAVEPIAVPEEPGEMEPQSDDAIDDAVEEDEAHTEVDSDPLAPANWRRFVPKTRRREHLGQARAVLVEWRHKTWLTKYRTRPFGPPGILPDSVITPLASRTTLLTIDDLRAVSWPLARLHGTEVLALLHALDERFALAKMELAREKRREKAAGEARRAREKDEKAREKVRKETERETEKARQAERRLRKQLVKEARALRRMRVKERANHTRALKAVFKEAAKWAAKRKRPGEVLRGVERPAKRTRTAEEDKENKQPPGSRPQDAVAARKLAPKPRP